MIAILLVLVICSLGDGERVMILGRVICLSRGTNLFPAVNASIQLYELDGISENDLLSTTQTDANGVYRLEGAEWEIDGIEPQIVVLHSCVDPWYRQERCQLKDVVLLEGGGEHAIDHILDPAKSELVCH